MLNLRAGGSYSRKEIWTKLRPGEAFPTGGNWLTDYASEGINLLIFANIGVPGKTGYDFPNQYDAATGKMVWYGKPNAHSAQPTFIKLFEGALKPQVFIRWDVDDPLFLYLGCATIEEFRDAVDLGDGVSTIRLTLSFSDDETMINPPPEGLPDSGSEGGRVSVQVNKYERDPRLRTECIRAHGPICKICSFDFEATFGELGRGYCHVHHVRPLSEVKQEHAVDPVKDLIPVCPNCHAMLHAARPALSPNQLGELLKDNLRSNNLMQPNGGEGVHSHGE